MKTNAFHCCFYFLRLVSLAGVSLSLLSADSNLMGAVTLTRGPYLQSCTATSIVIRWRTTSLASGQVHYGTNASDLDLASASSTPATDHEFKLANLMAGTKYFYAVHAGGDVLADGSDHFFATAPLTARPSRIWIIGDAGRANLTQEMVRDSYAQISQGQPTDVWLMLGDNTYLDSGADSGYQMSIFDFYPGLLPHTCFWPAYGNHENVSVFRDVVTLPSEGEAGGEPSHSELYFSFNHGNLHFVVLDSSSSSFPPTGAMLTWLEADLQANDRDWTIAYMHHPPYTKGSHDSDEENELISLRQNVVPILERHGVDLVLGGHSHVYERSYLLNGHYGFSDELTSSMILDGGSGRTNASGAYRKSFGPNQGTVYMVMGSSSISDVRYGLRHPAMYFGDGSPGSVILDVNELRLDARMLVSNGAINDYFTLIKMGGPPPRLHIERVEAEIVIWWMDLATALELQVNDGLSPDRSWSVVAEAPVVNGDRREIHLLLDSSQRFFRLHRR